MRITVVGAGIVGLTTARALEDAGHDVQVIAAARGETTTSAVAGAVWFPYRCGPPDRVAAWAQATRAWLLELAARDPSAGVDVLTSYEITPDDRDPWWAAAASSGPGGLVRAPAPVAGAPPAWRFTSPRAEPALLLPWLAARLARPIVTQLVTDLATVPGDLVIDCAGLGARALTSDPDLTPLLGQILLVARGAVDPAIALTDNREPDIFYLIPRRDLLVLGGTSLPWPHADAPAADPAISARILSHATRLGLPIGPLITTRVGLRPYRPTVRLERDPRDPRILHNYGHGGAGFTLCHGCALDIVALAA